jgi:Flp pilus assembly protein TadD
MYRSRQLSKTILVTALLLNSTLPFAADEKYSNDPTLQQAVQAWEKGNLKDAESLLNKLTTQHASDPTAWKKLYGIYMQQARYPDAALAMQKAILLSNPDPRLFTLIAYPYMHMGDHRAAESMLQEALRLNPTEEAALVLMTRVKERLSKSPGLTTTTH